MTDGIVLQKLNTLDGVLAELRSLDQVSIAQLTDERRIRHAIERDFQVLTEIIIDVCQRLLAVRGEMPASTARGAGQRCTDLGVLTGHDDHEPSMAMLELDLAMRRELQADQARQ